MVWKRSNAVLCTFTMADGELIHWCISSNGYTPATVSNITFSPLPVDSVHFSVGPTPWYKKTAHSTGDIMARNRWFRHIFLRATACNAKRVFATSEASVRLSLCCIVSKRRNLGSWNLHCRLPQGLILFCDKFSCRWPRGFPSSEGVKQGYPPVKSPHFTAIGSSSVRTVADKHRLAAYHNKHCWRPFRGYLASCIIVTWWDEPGEIESYLDN